MAGRSSATVRPAILRTSVMDSPSSPMGSWPPKTASRSDPASHRAAGGGIRLSRPSGGADYHVMLILLMLRGPGPRRILLPRAAGHAEAVAGVTPTGPSPIWVMNTPELEPMLPVRLSPVFRGGASTRQGRRDDPERTTIRDVDQRGPACGGWRHANEINAPAAVEPLGTPVFMPEPIIRKDDQ